LSETTEQIRAAYDKLRTTGEGGSMYQTDGFASLPEADRQLAISKIRLFNDFTPENDPHGEHDFGSVKVNGVRIYFKCETHGILHMNGKVKKQRMMTVMLADEY
jgi:Protein of unknown function (DUF3768)